MTFARAQGLSDVHERDEVVPGEDGVIEDRQRDREREVCTGHAHDIGHQLGPADRPQLDAEDLQCRNEEHEPGNRGKGFDPPTPGQFRLRVAPSHVDG